jgi:hypothetical protein
MKTNINALRASNAITTITTPIMQSQPSSSEYEAAITAMTHMLNCLDASSYDAQMTLLHKESRHNIDQVYDQCCKTKKITNADCQCFYANLKALEPLVSTDEGPEYTAIHNELIRCFRVAKRRGELVHM